jgi:hypothetical protein
MASSLIRKSEEFNPPDCARGAQMNDLEVRRVIYGLLQAGLVEMIRSQTGSPPAPSHRMFPTDNKDEQKSLVNRLITRIRSIYSRSWIRTSHNADRQNRCHWTF